MECLTDLFNLRSNWKVYFDFIVGANKNLKFVKIKIHSTVAANGETIFVVIFI